MTAEPGERRRVRYRLRSAPMQVAQQFLAALARDWDNPSRRCGTTSTRPHHATGGTALTSQNFTTSFTVEHSAEEVFEAITNVRGWWTGDIDGNADTLAAEFTYRYSDLHYSKQKVTELVPDQKLVWRVTEAHLTFLEDPGEWIDTKIAFEIVPQGARTEVRFAHEGLRSDFECFDTCSSAWGFFVNGSLRRLITTGEGPGTPPWEATA